MIDYFPDSHGALDLARAHRLLDAEPRACSTSLLPSIKRYDAAIFHMREYVPERRGPSAVATSGRRRSTRLRRRTWRSRPEDAAYIVDQFGIDVERPLLTQVSRFDPVEGPARRDRRVPRRQATRSPTCSWRSSARWRTTIRRAGTSTTRRVAYAGGDPDIYILSNLNNVGVGRGERVPGALGRRPAEVDQARASG